MTGLFAPRFPEGNEEGYPSFTKGQRRGVQSKSLKTLQYRKMVEPNPSLLQDSHHGIGFCHECPGDIARGSIAREFETNPEN